MGKNCDGLCDVLGELGGLCGENAMDLRGLGLFTSSVHAEALVDNDS